MAKRKFRFPWRIVLYAAYLVGGITGIVLLMGTIQVRSSEQACNALQIDILGAEAFIAEKDIERLITQEYGQLQGRTLESIPIHEIEQRLSELPYVSKARVSSDMNGLLHVQLWQRKAALRIIDQNGEGYYVDETGIKLPLSPVYAPRVPLAHGGIAEGIEQPLDSVETELVRGLFHLAQFISKDSIWSKQIAQIYVNPEGDIELIPSAGKHTIVLGDAQDLEGKFEKLMIFYRGILPKVGPRAYDKVNLKYKDQLVCTIDSTGIEQDSLVQLGSNSLNTQ